MSGGEEVARFLRIIIEQAVRSIHGLPEPGCLQICSRDPDDVERVAPYYWRFSFDRREDDLISLALRLNAKRRNVYIEGRTLRPDTKARGKMEETEWVFALVIDSDDDKAKAWTDNAGASLVVETSPGNFQFWFFLRTAIRWEEARAIGAAMRAFTRTDSDSGVPVQPYRIAGSINFPDAKKRARGRVPVQTRIVSHNGKLWTPPKLLAAFPPPPSPPPPPLPVGRSKAPRRILAKAGASAASQRAPSGRKVAPVTKRNGVHAPLPNGLTSAQILDRYPHIRGSLREQLLPAGGPLSSEDKSAMRWKLAKGLFERGVAPADAFALLVQCPWNPTGDDADPKRLLEKMWGVEIE